MNTQDYDLAMAAESFGLFKRPANWDALSMAEKLEHCHQWRLLAADSLARHDTFRTSYPQYRIPPYGSTGAIAPAKLTKPLYRSRRWPRPTIRNLIYHVCPLTANDLWKKNVAQLRRRLDVFSGRKVIAIATGKGCHPPATVRSELPGCEFLELPSDAELREVVTFLPLLVSVADPDPRQATFYAHTKGNSTDGSVQGSVYWRNAMYHHLLDRVGDCMEELETHACCGTHKMIWGHCKLGPPYPSGLNHGGWMLAGTFFWFRNDRVFSHSNWRHVPADRYGAEAWLSGLFHWAEAASVYQLWDEYEYPAPNPYDPGLYHDQIEDE